MNPTTMNPATINSNQALWEKGDFTRIAATMRESGDALVETLGIVPGLHVLDLGWSARRLVELDSLLQSGRSRGRPIAASRQ